MNRQVLQKEDELAYEAVAETRPRNAMAPLPRAFAVALPSPLLALRLACYLGGVALLSVPTLLGYIRVPLTGHTLGLINVCTFIGALALFALTCHATVPRVLHRFLPAARPLAVVGLLTMLGLSYFSVSNIRQYSTILTRRRHYWNDSIAETDCAARLLLRHRNPYTDFSLVACFALLHMDGRFTTPLHAGVFGPNRPTYAVEIRLFDSYTRRRVQHPPEFESWYSYPAGSFLLVAPVLALGAHELAIFYIACFVLAYGLLAWRAPPALRPWFVPIALGNLRLWDYAIHGYSEGSVILLVLVAWLTWRHPWPSALVMGLAVATRQEAWLIVPFYLIRMGHAHGWATVARCLGIIGVLFTIVNAPFVEAAPHAWMEGVLAPLTHPMYPGGVGFVELATTGWIPLWPRASYTGLEIVAAIACLSLYGYVGRRHPHVALVLALVPLIFAWRSLSIYFSLPLPIYCLAPLIQAARTAR